VEKQDRPDTFDRAGVSAWLAQRVTVTGMDSMFVRVDADVTLDPCDPLDVISEQTGGPSSAALDAYRRGEWWSSRCVVKIRRIMLPTGGRARWLELGAAERRRMPEGTLPWDGGRFVSLWEDRLSTWLDLAQAAANEAEEALESLQGVTVTWTREPADVPADAR
jgi:hypothetical protein